MLSPADRQRARFRTGDRVTFTYRRRTAEGSIIRLNPKRAVVEHEGEHLAVPYNRLVPMAGKSAERIQRLEHIQAMAEAALEQHGLKQWHFVFDHSTRRAGCCDYRNKRISIAMDLAATGADHDIQDTLLHEIAHALVGRRHSHDAVWKAKALEIGGTGRRTHKLQFSTPRWTVTCENRCWTHTAQKRNPRLVCRTCGTKLIYTPYSA